MLSVLDHIVGTQQPRKEGGGGREFSRLFLPFPEQTPGVWKHQEPIGGALGCPQHSWGQGLIRWVAGFKKDCAGHNLKY